MVSPVKLNISTMSSSDATYESWGANAHEFRNGTVCIGIDLGTTNSC